MGALIAQNDILDPLAEYNRKLAEKAAASNPYVGASGEDTAIGTNMPLSKSIYGAPATMAPSETDRILAQAQADNSASLPQSGTSLADLAAKAASLREANTSDEEADDVAPPPATTNLSPSAPSLIKKLPTASVDNVDPGRNEKVEPIYPNLSADEDLAAAAKQDYDAGVAHKLLGGIGGALSNLAASRSGIPDNSKFWADMGAEKSDKVKALLAQRESHDKGMDRQAKALELQEKMRALNEANTIRDEKMKPGGEYQDLYESLAEQANMKNYKGKTAAQIESALPFGLKIYGMKATNTLAQAKMQQAADLHAQTMDAKAEDKRVIREQQQNKIHKDLPSKLNLAAISTADNLADTALKADSEHRASAVRELLKAISLALGSKHVVRAAEIDKITGDQNWWDSVRSRGAKAYEGGTSDATILGLKQTLADMRKGSQAEYNKDIAPINAAIQLYGLRPETVFGKVPEKTARKSYQKGEARQVNPTPIAPVDDTYTSPFPSSEPDEQ